VSLNDQYTVLLGYFGGFRQSDLPPNSAAASLRILQPPFMVFLTLFGILMPRGVWGTLSGVQRGRRRGDLMSGKSSLLLNCLPSDSARDAVAMNLRSLLDQTAFS
jgi:hypothetical protein